MLEKPSNLERYDDEAAVFAAKSVQKTPRNDKKGQSKGLNGDVGDVISKPVN